MASGSSDPTGSGSHGERQWADLFALELQKYPNGKLMSFRVRIGPSFGLLLVSLLVSTRGQNLTDGVKTLLPWLSK